MAQTREFVLGMVVGAAVGAAVAVLYAPQSGPETREYLKGKAGDLKDATVTAVGTAQTRVKDVASNVATSTQQLVDRSRTAVEQKVGAVKAAVEAGQQAFQDKSTELNREVQADLNPTGTAGNGGTSTQPGTA